MIWVTQVAPDSDARAAHGQLVPDDHVIVLFGATGDLARRKLLPALYRLAEAGLLPERFRIVGSSQPTLSGEEFRAFARATVDGFCRCGVDGEAWDAFSSSSPARV